MSDTRIRRARRQLRRWAMAAIACLVMSVGCSSESSTGDSSQRPEAVACPSGSTSAAVMVDGGASAPLCVDGTWIFDIPGRANPPTVCRSEMVLSRAGRPIGGREGSTVVHDVTVTGVLGAAGRSDKSWHVLWQLQGPRNDGSWPPPTVGLQVRNGQLLLGGGPGHPNHDWRNRNYEWRVRLGDYRDNAAARVRIVVKLSSDPAKGRISAWLGGRQILSDWIPVSPQGLKPGTLYPNQPGVASRIGLYRGSQGEAPPTYRQVVTQQLNEISGA